MKRILIVEDDELLQVLLKDEFMDEGYEAVVAANGAEAMLLIHEYLDSSRQIDLVIMDIRMPKMDGLDVLGCIVKSALDVPIIIHTAYSGYRDHPIILAADAYVIKSHDLSGLKDTVRTLMDKCHSSDGGASAAKAHNSKGPMPWTFS